MDIKKYLKTIGQMSWSIEQKKRELAELRASAEEIGSIDLSCDKVISSRKSTDAGFVNTYMTIDALCRSIDADIAELALKKHEIISRILCMENAAYSKLLMLHYVQLLSLSEIAEKLYYSYKYIVKLHTRAIAAFEKLCLQMDAPEPVAEETGVMEIDKFVTLSSG